MKLWRVIPVLIGLAIAVTGSVAVYAGGPPSVTSNSLIDTGVFGTIAGTSDLMRTDDGISMNLHGTGFMPGAYSIWFVFPDGEAGPTHAAGHIVGKSGNGNFSGHIQSDFAMTADVMLVVRFHGEALPGAVPDQIRGTPSGGCPPNTCSTVATSSLHAAP